MFQTWHKPDMSMSWLHVKHITLQHEWDRDVWQCLKGPTKYRVEYKKWKEWEAHVQVLTEPFVRASGVRHWEVWNEMTTSCFVADFCLVELKWDGFHLFSCTWEDEIGKCNWK